MQKIIGQIAQELNVKPQQVSAAVELLDGGATVPFVARYRKEATGGLDDTQLRTLDERLTYLRELDDRRETVLKAIDEQGKLTDALRLAIASAPTKQELEDITCPSSKSAAPRARLPRSSASSRWPTSCLPTPRWTRTRKPRLSASPRRWTTASPAPTSAPLLLDGVRDILSERWAEDPALVQKLREWLWDEGLLKSKKVEQERERPRGRQVPRLLRIRRAHWPRALAPCAGRVPRPCTGGSRSQAGATSRA
jgi:uncharacterized protein